MALARKIQLSFIWPLIIAILICVVITISLLFTQNQEWFDEAKDEILKNEDEHLLRMVKSRSATISEIFFSVAQDMFFISGYYQSLDDGKITVSDNFSTISQNAYEVLESTAEVDYPDTSKSMWYMQDQRTLPAAQQADYDLVSKLELVYRPLYESQTRKRFGFSFTYENSGLTYQYPVDELTYLTDEQYKYDDCSLGDGSFDMRCTSIYKELHEGSNSLIFKRELGRFMSCSKVAHGQTSCELLPNNYTENILEEFEDYSTFAATIDGLNVLTYDGRSQDELEGKTLAQVLINDDDLHKDFNADVIPTFVAVNDTLIEYEGDDGTVHLAESRVQLLTSGMDTDEVWSYDYVVGFQIDEDDILSDFNDAKEEIFVNLFIQLGIYVLFLILVFVFAFWLAKLVVKNIVSPIDKLVEYLDNEKIETDEKDKPIMQNKEFNEISDLFRKLFILFRFAKPDFFDTAIQDRLLENYETARKLFEEINNDRGKAICLNNMGNIQYDMGNYQVAIDKFIDAWKSTQVLKQTVAKEINDEEKNSEGDASEPAKQGVIDKKKELSAIEDLIFHRLMQIVMAQEKSIECEDSKINWSQRRVIWKEILNSRAEVLQYDLNHRRNLIRVIENLIGMAKCFQGLQYSRTADDLISETEHIITKLEKKNPDTDVDITRLRRIGIDVDDKRAEDASHFFSLDQKNFGRQLQILKQKAYYRKGLILAQADRYRSAAEAFTDSIEKCDYYDDETRKACFHELMELFRKANIENEELRKMNDVYSKNEREFLFLCAYEMFYPSTRVTRTNTCIQDFVTNEVHHQKDKIGIYTCYEGPIYQLEMVQRDDPCEDIVQFCGKMPKSSTRIMHPFDIIVRCLRLFSSEAKTYLVFIIRSIKCIPADVKVHEIVDLLQKMNVNLFIVVVDNMDDDEELMVIPDLETLVHANSMSEGDLYQCNIDELKDIMSEIEDKIKK